VQVPADTELVVQATVFVSGELDSESMNNTGQQR